MSTQNINSTQYSTQNIGNSGINKNTSNTGNNRNTGNNNPSGKLSEHQGVYFSSSVKISDPDNGKIILNIRGD